MENERAMSGCGSNVKLCRYDWVVSCDGEVLVQWMLFLGRGARDLWESVVVVLHHFIIKRRERDSTIIEFDAITKPFTGMSL